MCSSDLLVKLAGAQQLAGQPQAAINSWEQAVARAEQSGDRQLILLAKSSVGGACGCLQQRSWAETNLRDAIKLAEEFHDDRALAQAWCGLGHSLAMQGKTTDALAAFEKAAADPVMKPVALVNGAAVAGNATWNERARAAVAGVGRSHEQARLWLRCAETELRAGDLAHAETSARSALELAEELSDPRLRSYATGQLGRAAELRGDMRAALDSRSEEHTS